MRLLSLIPFLLPFATAIAAQDRLAVVDITSIPQRDRDLLAGAGKTNTLGCSLTPLTPQMGLDLRFRAGFTGDSPLDRLGGGGGALRAVVLVTPLAASAAPTVLEMQIRTPRIAMDASGKAEFTGEYVVGPGRYRTATLLEYGDRVCVQHWDIEAKPEKALAAMPLPLQPGAVEALPENPFSERSELRVRAAHPLRVKLLVNFAPAAVDGAVLVDDDIRAITSILRAVTRETRFGQFEVVAFSSELQRVIARRPPAARIDFAGLGRAVRGLRSGTISLAQLRNPRSGAEFLADLLETEMTIGPRPPDAVLVISPKVYLDEKLPERELAERAHLQCPVFLLSYTPDARMNPWDGALGSAIKKAYRGAAFVVASPRDLSRAFQRLRSDLRF
jgi:hypothetical protein